MADQSRLRNANRRQRLPAVPIVLAACLGIVTDWYCHCSFEASLFLSFLFIVCWVCLFGWPQVWRRVFPISTSCLLGACACLGSAWHQLHWSLIEQNSLLAYATDEPKPARLMAVIMSVPVRIDPEVSDFPSALPKRSRTLVNVQACSLMNRDEEVPVRGLVQLDVAGEVHELLPGTQIEILGLLSRPPAVRNPGGFDYRMFLRERGIHTIIRAEFPDAIRVLKNSPGGIWPRVQIWQKTCAERLRSQLSSRNAPVAIALLLGPRTDIPKELKDAFLQTGTVHFLAISGANVAILMLLLWPFSRILGMSIRTRMVVIAVCLWAYVMITDGDPPVIRAAVIVTVWLMSLFAGRGPAVLNQFALSALLVAIRNPHDVFQAGTQLSFLAILALYWLSQQPWLTVKREVDPLDTLMETGWQKAWIWVVRYCKTVLAASTTVWLITLPLILARFHLVSPLGFVVNIFLSLWMVATLLSGYLYLVCVIVWPLLGWLPGLVFDLCLSVFTSSVRLTASLPGSHFQLPGPPDWWLAVYAVIIVALCSGVMNRSGRLMTWRLLGIWFLAGLAAGLPPERNPGLRCTFLSVGHGAAILLEFPNRQTLLYDAGSLEDASRASRAVEGLMVERGLTRLDAVLVSHADIDHFNALPRLIEQTEIGQILISPAFLDFRQSSVVKVCTAAIDASVPVKLVWAGDRLDCGPDVQVEILHPAVPGVSADDNANSVVLSISYAGRRILLTGDLEKAGLTSLLRQAARPHDVLLSPHHGSQQANPAALARWVAPRWVVVSAGRDAAWAKLAESYGPGVTLLSTRYHGAVTIEVTDDGNLLVNTHLPAIPLVAPSENSIK